MAPARGRSRPSADRHPARRLLGIFTATGTGGDGAGVERFLPPGRTTLCAYGRQAMALALQRLGAGPGDVVLVPGFVCRELLGAVSVSGAAVRFYAVDERLQIVANSLESDGGGRVVALVAVNYFGFPQDLRAASAWCRARGAALIEDNAHGFLSVDGAVPLGHRGDFGIFSLRKTLAVPNGGALVDNRGVDLGAADAPVADVPRVELAWRAKRLLKRTMGIGGPLAVRGLLGAVRGTRRVVTGSSIAPPPADAESTIPAEALSALTPRLLRSVAVAAESARRRSLFLDCAALLGADADVRPVFSDLPPGVVSQGFPFFYRGCDPESFADRWWRRGVPIVRWPDLPDAIAPQAPPHYRSVMLVPFLW